jgi:hypothetical protein
MSAGSGTDVAARSAAALITFFCFGVVGRDAVRVPARVAPSGLRDHSGIEADFGFDTTLRAAHTEIRR